jgi:hypothetical protein
VPHFGEFRIGDLIQHVDRKLKALELAEKLGTLNADDRSKQYPLDQTAQIVKAVNECWIKVHEKEKADKKKDEQIHELRKKVESRIWHRIVVVVATAEFTIIIALLKPLIAELLKSLK